jgi:crotonobetainyl-CoA:carnitine CoA-transferase CaiB-like acyl-CoA transferase
MIEMSKEAGTQDASPPLDGLMVLDMSQFLSGPSATLRLADLGARVIKIERPGSGDICRQLYLTDTEVAGDSTLFHAINRNKESFSSRLMCWCTISGPA